MIHADRFFSFACLVVLLFVAGCSLTGPSGAVKKFYRLVEDGRVEEAADMFSTELFSVIGRDKVVAGLSEQTRDISLKGGIDSIDILSEEVNGQVADIRVRILYGNGNVDREDIQLTKLDGKWKLTPDMGK